MTAFLQFKTNLNCDSCIAAVKPFLDEVPNITHWEVDTATNGKLLKVTGIGLSANSIAEAVRKAGFSATDDTNNLKRQPDSIEAVKTPTGVTYFPLLLLGAFLLGVVSLVELRIGTLDLSRAMQNFMGAFFAAFAFFKLLDLRGFAESYRMYDIVAGRFPWYGVIYPFIELALAAAYITGIRPFAINLTTLMVMSVSSIGVIQSVLRKRKIRCACLGTAFNLPMSTVTLVEDGLMIGMAAAGLLGLGH
ncbi:MAG: heavy-metal-associated domain-containing protein [Planctomyces sp.]|nr:heavy-metal-associated domain-containing protein [Planctomyces sp.]